jgi:hypothetical protein
MRSISLLFLVIVLASASGCRKKSAPQFFEAERRHQSLVARDGDDAYLSLDMDGVLDLLRQVPADAVEAARAQELAKTIQAAQARVRAEREAEGKAPPPAEEYVRADEGSEPVAPREETPLPIDGPPPGGMPEADFTARYQGCVTGPKEIPVDVPPGKAPAYAVRETPECQKKLFVTGNVQFFFLEKRLAGRVVTRTEGGAKPVTAEAPKAPPGEPESEQFLLVPGAPLPKALQGKVPPPNTGAMPAATTGEGIKEAPVAPTLPARTE